MDDEIVYKKVTRKSDKGLEGKIIAKHGKQTYPASCSQGAKRSYPIFR